MLIRDFYGIGTHLYVSKVFAARPTNTDNLTGIALVHEGGETTSRRIHTQEEVVEMLEFIDKEQKRDTQELL